MEGRSGGLNRKKALDMSDVIQMYIKSMKITAGLNTRRIFKAWDEASGAAQFTMKRFFRDGKLFITLNSSMARLQLSMQTDLMKERINRILENDELFIKDDPKVGYVDEIILK